MVRKPWFDVNVYLLLLVCHLQFPLAVIVREGKAAGGQQETVLGINMNQYELIMIEHLKCQRCQVWWSTLGMLALGVQKWQDCLKLQTGLVCTSKSGAPGKKGKQNSAF